MWTYQPSLNNNVLHKQIEIILIDQFKQQSDAQLEKSNIEHICTSLKQLHEFEDYFTIFKRHEYLFDLRIIDCHRSRPVRWSLVGNRKCLLCDLNQIDAEQCLLQCPYFADGRRKYIRLNSQLLQTVVEHKMACNYT